MANGSISQAAAGITAPSSGGVGSDLGSAFGAALSGLLEERRRQEELRLREAALSLEERRVDLAGRQVDLQERGLEQELDLADREYELARDQYEEGIRQFNAEQARLRDVQEAAGRGAMKALVEEYNYDQAYVESLTPESALERLQHEQNLEIEGIRGAAEVYVSSSQLALANLDAYEQRLMNAQERYNDVRSDFEEWTEQLTTHPLTGEILNIEMDARIRDPGLRQAYAQGEPAAAALLEGAEANLQSLLENRDQTIQQMQQLLQDMEGALPSFGRNGRGRLGGPVSAADQTPFDRIRDQAEFQVLLRDDPIVAAGMIPQLEAGGFDVDGALAETGLTRQQLADSVTEAFEAAQEAGLEPSAAGGRPQELQPSRRLLTPQGEITDISDAGAVEAFQETVQSASLAEIQSVAQRLIARGLISRESALDVIEQIHGGPTRSYINNRLPNRVAP